MRLVDWFLPSGLVGDRPGIGTSSDVKDPCWRIKHCYVDAAEQWNGKSTLMMNLRAPRPRGEDVPVGRAVQNQDESGQKRKFREKSLSQYEALLTP